MQPTTVTNFVLPEGMLLPIVTNFVLLEAQDYQQSKTLFYIDTLLTTFLNLVLV